MQTEHSKNLEYLIHHPRTIGIYSQIIWSAKEMLVYRNNGRGLITDIDLFFQTKGGIYIVEYKMGDHKLEAILQLKRAAAFVREEFGELPKQLYTHGPQYLTEEVE
jgi:hypothetical protein